MTTASYSFGLSTYYTTPTQRVWLKQRWEQPWTLYPYLHCERAQWTVNPKLPEAELSWLYGSIMQVGDNAYRDYSKLNVEGWYVLVEYTTEQAASFRRWLGIITAVEDRMGGDVVTGIDRREPGRPKQITRATGEQRLTAFGIERLLADHEIKDAVWDRDGTFAGVTRMHTPATFNANGRPNRSASPIDVGDGRFVYVFSADKSTAAYWSTDDILDYLLFYAFPTGPLGFFPMRIIRDGARWYNWDRPVLSQYRQTVYGLLDRLINRHRMMSWWLSFQRHTADEDDPPPGPDPSGDTLYLSVQTTSAVPIPNPLAGATFPPADELRSIVLERDPHTSVVVGKSEFEKVDQVIVRGGKRRSVFSIGINDADSLVEGWTDDERVEYERGASANPDYEAAGTEARQRLNAEHRARQEFEHVYSLFEIPVEWDYLSSGGDDTQDDAAVFPPSVPPEVTGGGVVRHYPYYPDLVVLPELPLIEGVDYSGARIETRDMEDEEGQRTPPLCFFQRPDDIARYISVAKIGEVGKLEGTPEKRAFDWSASVNAESSPTFKGLRLRVSGQPKHVIEAENFNALAEDERLGNWNYVNAIFTVAVEEDRWVEGKFPETLPKTGVDIYRFKVIEVEHGYRKDYVVPGTVVGFNDNGILRTKGGYIPRPKPTDDEHQLQAIARLAAGWYMATRSVLALESNRLPADSSLNLQHMITSVGTNSPAGHYDIVNSPVTSISVRSPRGTPEAPRPVEFRLMTWAGELDATLLVPKHAST